MSDTTDLLADDAATDDLCDDGASYIDALIKEQESIIMGIDAMLTKRSMEEAPGGGVTTDFAAWAVRACERRQYAAARLGELTRQKGESDKREARLMARVTKLRAQVDDLRRDLSVAYEQRAALGAEISRLQTGHAAKSESVRAARLNALLDGERAILHPTRAESFLRMAAGAVPAAYRDAFVAQCVSDGYPAPRTSAECVKGGVL